MAKDKQIQELEIQVNVKGDKAAESRIDRLLNKKERLDKANFDSIKAEKTEALRSSRARKAEIDEILKQDDMVTKSKTKLRSEGLKDLRLRKSAESKAGKNLIPLTRRRYKVSEQYSMFTTMGKSNKEVLAKIKKEEALKNKIVNRLGQKPSGFIKLEKYEKNAIAQRKIRERVNKNVNKSFESRTDRFFKKEDALPTKERSMFKLSEAEIESSKDKIIAAVNESKAVRIARNNATARAKVIALENRNNKAISSFDKNKALKEKIRSRLGKTRSGFFGIEDARNKILARKSITDKVLKNLATSEASRGTGVSKFDVPVTRQNSALAIEQAAKVNKLKETIRARLGSGTGGFASIDKTRADIISRNKVKDRIMANIEANREMKGRRTSISGRRFDSKSFASIPVSEQNSVLKKTNKTLRERLSIENLLSKRISSNNKAQSKGGAGRRSGGGLVGSAMLYLGAATMIQYMAGSAFQGAMALGDTAATVESDVLKGRAFQERYRKNVGDSGFDDSVDLYSKLSGQSKYLARSQMAQVAGSLEAAGVNLKGEQLTGVARATRGLSGGMGITEDMASQKILGLLSGRMSATDAGLVGVKRSSDPSKTLDNILKFMEKNAVTAAVMKAGTMSSIMARLRSAPKGLIAGLYKDSPLQMMNGMKVFADWVDSFTDSDNTTVSESWKRTMKQFEQASVNVFGESATNFSRDMSIATAVIIKGVELGARTVKAMYQNPLLAAAIPVAYRMARKSGMPTLRKIPSKIAGKTVSKVADVGLKGLGKTPVILSKGAGIAGKGLGMAGKGASKISTNMLKLFSTKFFKMGLLGLFTDSTVTGDSSIEGNRYTNPFSDKQTEEQKKEQIRRGYDRHRLEGSGNIQKIYIENANVIQGSNGNILIDEIHNQAGVI